jgi:DNA modification methylase
VTWRIINADVLEGLAQLEDESVQCVVTSPPYWGLRDYGVPGQLGLEKSPEAYVERMVAVFREVRRVLRKDGTLWLNMGDCYAANRSYQVPDSAFRDVGNSKASSVPAGLKPKDLVGMPWRLAFALQADGWWLRCDIIWSKPNPMPESIKDRPTKAHEYVFLMSKSARYCYDAEAIREEAVYGDHNRNVDYQYSAPGQPAQTGLHKAGPGPRKTDKQRGHGRRHAGFNDRWDAMSKAEQAALGRNKRSVWIIATQPYPEAHFATFPENLVEPCIRAGCPEAGLVLDPFCGSGTTGAVAVKLGRSFVGIELNPEYVKLARKRIGQAAPLFAREAK